MNHQKPEVGQFFIEKEYNYGSQWIVKIIKSELDFYVYEIITLIGSLDKSSKGLIFTLEKSDWFNEFRHLTDNEKIDLL